MNVFFFGGGGGVRVYGVHYFVSLNFPLHKHFFVLTHRPPGSDNVVQHSKYFRSPNQNYLEPLLEVPKDTRLNARF